MIKTHDLLIIGQGLAGINLSFRAHKAGLSCYHVHQSTIGESTKVAAGLINPITGRRFVTSWRIHDVMPYAEEHYKELGHLLESNYIDRMNIVRVFKNYADENSWLAKSADPYLKQFVLEHILLDREVMQERLELPEILGELQNCYKINLIELQEDYIKYLTNNDSILHDSFNFDQLEISEDYVEYNGIKAKNIVFCEGWKVRENPYFDDIPFAPAKGELFIIRAPLLKLDAAYKKDMFITPLGNDQYWVGASYEWQNYDPNVSDKMKNRLLDSLNAMIKVPYEIIDHLAGIRPSSKDRRPVMGNHKLHPNVYLFNGMGTKGSSLSPYFADQLIHHISDGKSIDSEVDVKRYYN